MSVLALSRVALPLAGSLVLLSWLGACTTTVPPPANPTVAADAATVARGKYLVRAGDCVSCHTAIHGKPFAGGFPVPTPFGDIYSVNITPDRETGIGNWTEQDFYRAMHEGIGKGGRHLYPAFPYPWFTKVTRADVDAIKAYLDTLAPVSRKDTPNELPWYLSWRGELAAWNMLYFDDGEYEPDRARSRQWNRGAYLVHGLSHCSACHTPKTWLGGTKHDEAFTGGEAGLHWYAPGLGDNLRDGVGGWSTAEIVEYLKTGSNAKSAAVGPMTEVVTNSTQYLSDSDLQAIAVYLKNRPNAPAKTLPEVDALGAAALARGHALYLDNCIACHMPDGRGVTRVFPPLTGSALIQADDPGTVIHVVLAGARMAAPASKPTGLAMPGFGWKMDDQQVADVVNYIRHAWGNRAPLADAGAVAAVRKDILRSELPSRGHAPIPHPDAHARPALWNRHPGTQLPVKSVQPVRPKQAQE